MVVKVMRCIHCGGGNVVKYGKNPKGKQRLKCKDCSQTFQMEYSNKAATPDTKLLIIKMSLNGSGIRDIARVLEICTNTVLNILKKLKSS
jgi:insertion element IS1 protein InsB